LHDGVAKQTSLEIHAQVRVSIENLSHRVEFDLRERHEGMLRALPRKILPVVSTLINKKNTRNQTSYRPITSAKICPVT
jgi:hypothetical protein